MDNALEITGLTKRYGEFTLDNVSFTLPRGTIMGLIGENGAGKSTTIKLILDLAHRDAGEISVLGSGMTKKLRESIGVVMDECNFPDEVTASDVGRIMKGIFSTWSDVKYASYMKKFELPQKLHIKKYSRGMRMKLSIATALSHDSELLILDEPTSGLDPIVRDEILDVFMEYIQDERRSVLISSHIISDLEKICDYVAFLHKGRLVFCKAKDELCESYVIAKLTHEQFEDADKRKIIGSRIGGFGVEALMLRENAAGYVADAATIEDIMLYHVREGR